MLRDITLGQYYQTDSLIHRLDPRTKISGTFFFIVTIFMAKNVLGYAIAAAFLVMCIKLSKVPFKYMVRGMKAILLLLLITVVFNLFMTPGEVMWSFWKINITKEGLENAVKMALRLTFLILGSGIMTLTTTPNSLTDGLEKLLGPLKKIRVPVHEIAMMMSIALRFIPILIEETDKIMKAQMARGADFDSGNIFRRAKALIPLLVPLIISAFRRAGDLAMAMEARCYRGDVGRTRMKPLHYERRDYIAYLVMILTLVMCIVFGRKIWW